MESDVVTNSGLQALATNTEVRRSAAIVLTCCHVATLGGADMAGVAGGAQLGMRAPFIVVRRCTAYDGGEGVLRRVGAGGYSAMTAP